MTYTRRAPREERMVAVYPFGHCLKTKPILAVNAETARSWIDEGSARRSSKWTIILTKPLPLQLRGPSANIRESTILAAISGSRYHQSLIASWA